MRKRSLLALVCALVAPVAAGAQVNPFETGQDQVLAAENEFLTQQAGPVDVLKLDIYGDAGAGYTSGAGQHPGFHAGAVDFFVTADISDSIRVLSEDVLEVLDEGAKFEIERLHLDFLLNPWFNVRLGREHTPIGFFSQAYHHPHLFMLGATRPTMYAYEDEGGILPAHVVGASIFGEGTLGDAITLHYDLGVANGRGASAEDVQNGGDRDLAKALYGRLVLRPRGAPGLEFGASAYMDKLRPPPADAANPATFTTAQETMFGGHLVYQGYPVDAIVEVFHIAHAFDAPNLNLSWNALTAQLGSEFAEFVTPYARFDLIAGSKGDPFFAGGDTIVDTSKATAGLRFRLDPKATLKIEGSRELKNDINAALIEAAFGL